MTLQRSFLTLSIKDQVCLTIFILTIFSILVILCLPCSFSYEILREDYKKKKKFFYNEFKKYIEACFFYQGYHLLKYEELIKRMHKQAYKYSTREGIFNYTSEFKKEFTDDYPIKDLRDDIDEDDKNRNDILYYYCFNKEEEKCKAIKELLKEKYDSIYSLLFSTDVYNRFRIPGLYGPIVNKAMSVSVNNSFIFSFDKDIIKNNININFENYIQELMDFIILHLNSYLDFDFFLYESLFSKIEGELNSSSLMSEVENNITNKDKIIFDFAKEKMGYFSSINFANDKSYLSSYNPENDNIYYLELDMPSDFLMNIHQSISVGLDVDFIPLHPDNETLLFSDICLFFLMKQTHDIYTEDAINDLFKKIRKGNITINDCFWDKNIFEKQKIIKEIFDNKEKPFLDRSNKIYQGMFNIGGNNILYYMKYSFPNMNLLYNFQSDYLILDQINFYLFASFKEPIENSNFIWAQYKNLFYLIVILIIYIWLICFAINMLIFYKIIKQITEPIYKLLEAIKTNNIKDETIFKYEYDDIINELFITCKELLTRQIDTSNSLKFSNQFNVLNIGKEEHNLVDKNKYEKNLIINNDLMNRLISEQQNLNDLSDDIDINTDTDIDDCINKENTNKKSTKEDEPNIKENNKEIHCDEKDKINQNKINDEEDKKPYKYLFQLAEYLYYYRCKNEENIVNINISEQIEDKKSKKKVKKKLSKQTNSEYRENISINMFEDKDVTYLWYMEMKKKKNRSFNYEIGDDYEELFTDYND